MSVDTFAALMNWLAKWFEELMKMFAHIKGWADEVSSKFEAANKAE